MNDRTYVVRLLSISDGNLEIDDPDRLDFVYISDDNMAIDYLMSRIDPNDEIVLQRNHEKNYEIFSGSEFVEKQPHLSEFGLWDW